MKYSVLEMYNELEINQISCQLTFNIIVIYEKRKNETLRISKVKQRTTRNTGMFKGRLQLNTRS